jgi:hypothetical protein
VGVGNIVSDLQKASTNDSAHARMRLPSIRFFNRVCVCIKGQPCWCKTRTRGDSSSVSTHSLLPRSGTGLIPHKVYIPAHCSFTSTLTNNTGTLPRLSLTYQEAHQKTTPHFRILETQELSHSDHFCLKVRNNILFKFRYCLKLKRKCLKVEFSIKEQ